jgi:predicted NAD/FAD-dependent oxidoreductase
MSSFCVIGSGISGATIANLLNKRHTVDLYDKARGLGGRSSFKRLDNQRGFDHGTQYFSPKTSEFKRFTKKLIEKKILKIWGGNHKFLSDKKKENKKHVKVIGRKGNNDISKYLLKNVKCYFQSELKKINFQNRKWNLTFNNGEIRNYEYLILTCPFPQLKKLSKKYIKNSFIREKIKMDANITILIEIKKTNLGYSSFLFNDRILGWAGYENSKKRFKSKSDLWTLQSTFNWANKKINQNKVLKKTNAKILIDKFFKLTGIKQTKILFSLNHGWKYSSNSKPLKLKSYWNSRLNLGVCADWFNGPRLESGWISANDLYKKINS